MWPTPTANAYAVDPETYQKRTTELKKQNFRAALTIASAVRMWPTPSASMGGGESIERAEQKAQMYREGRGSKLQVQLPLAVKMCPTPVASEAEKASRIHGNGSRTLTGEAGGALAPTFVEWLQGFPIGWTDLERSETQSFLRAHNTLLKR